MIEKDLEDKIIAKFKTLLPTTVQIIGSWEVTATDKIKAEQENERVGYVIVKAQPRAYQNAIVPECQIDININLIVRADIDYSGSTYLDLTEIMIGQFETWQKCQTDTHTDFTTDKFDVTGFMLGNGNSGIQDDRIWAYSHNLTVYGVIIN